MSAGAPVTVFLVDDHQIVRQGLRAILELDRGIRVVGEAGDAAAALPLIGARQPAVVLLDLSLGTHGPTAGLDACRAITARYPAVGVIILTTFLDERLVLEAIESGAKGYVLKDVDAVDLIRMIRAVSRGEAAIDTRITSLVLRTVANRGAAQPAPPQLSGRELEVVRLLKDGHSNREIGAQLHLSESTIKYHLRNIMDKLAVRHRTEVVYAASKLGLV